MTTNLNATNTLFLANLNRIEQRLADANNQISSGQKINVASDAPDQIDSLLQLRADRLQNQQIQSNLTLALTDAQAADNALTGAISLMDRATTLASEGTDISQDANTRASMASEAQSLLEQMVSYSQTQVQGHYSFSGDQDRSPSYQVNLNAADGSGVDQLTAAPATHLVEDPAGGSFATSQTAQTIFGPTTQSVDANGNPITVPAQDNSFAALNSLHTALLNNDTTGIDNAINAIKASVAHLNSMQAFYGSVEDRIQSATSFATSYDTQLQAEISAKQDADIPTAALELTQSNTELQAALTMQGKMPTSTLFNYLG